MDVPGIHPLPSHHYGCTSVLYMIVWVVFNVISGFLLMLFANLAEKSEALGVTDQ